MQEWAKVVGILGLALIVGATLVLTGPVGKALAEWIRGWSKHDARWLDGQAAKQGGGRDATEPVLLELDELKHRLAEVEERLDFAKRLLAKERLADRLAPPR